MNRASQHHFLYRSKDYWPDLENDAGFFERRAARRAHIGRNTWIGHAAVIKPDITVGDGAVVAANAVVTKDVAPYTIVAGIPQGRSGSDSPHIAERLMALAWWDWDHDRIGLALGDFRTLTAEGFLEKHGG